MTTTSTAVVVLDTPELEAIEASKAEPIRRTFTPMADMLRAFEDDYGEIMEAARGQVTPELSARARRLRLNIAKVRVRAEKRRKELKREYLLAGRAIDGTNNILKWAINQKEEALEAIEKHVERMEAERIERLQEERAEALAPYVEDAHERDLGTMEGDVWDAYLTTKRKEHKDRLEAERKAEEERKERERIAALDRERTRESAPFYDFLPEAVRDSLGELTSDEYGEVLEGAKEAKAAHEAEQEQVRKERARLEKQKAAAELKRKAELARIEKERKAERAKLEAQRQKEQEKREALEKAERERKAKEEAERKAREKAEAEAAKAPTKNRLTAWVESFALPELPGKDHEAAGRIRDKFDGFREWAKKEVDKI